MATPSKISALQSLSADVLSAPSAPAIAELLSRDLGPLLGLSGAGSVRLYLFKAANRSLESVLCSYSAEPIAASVDRPPEGIVAAAVRCFRQASVVNIPRLRRDESVNPDGKKGLPSSAVFAPVLLNGKTLGVIEAVRTSRFGSFDANQISILKLIATLSAAALELQQHNNTQEQLAKSEQLAATAQLIANASADLRPRLQRVLSLFGELPETFLSNPVLCDAREETLHAAETVTRLMSFGSVTSIATTSNTTAPAPATESGANRTRAVITAIASDSPVDVNTLLAELTHFRAPHWNTLGLRIQNHVPPETAFVQGQRGQLEHAFLDMALYAERAAADSYTKLLAIATTQIAGRVVVQLLFPAPANTGLPNTSCPTSGSDIANASLELCQQVAHRHQGEFQLRSQTNSEGFDLSLEMNLPLSTPSKNHPENRHMQTDSYATPEHPLTLLLVDSDPAARKQLLGLVAQRGHRVIPVPAEETPSLAQRMRFDGILWAVRSGPGAKWSDYQQRLRELIPAVVLVSSGYDAALASSMGESGGYLLARPVDETELDRLLETLTANCAVQV